MSAPRREPDRSGRLARLVDSDAFNLSIAVVIVVNAVVLGLDTFPEVADRYGSLLLGVNQVLYFVYVAELILRFASYGRHPQDFFRSGWNIFDLVVIGAVLIPGVADNTQLLRILRLARIARLLRFLPDARMLLATILRSIPPLGSLVVLTFLLLFMYGMLGWSVFGQALPNEWGTITRAMLTLFVLLTLENFPTYLDAAREVTPWATVYFVSYVLIAAFVVFNLLIGIIIGSMERAREQQDADDRAKQSDATAAALERIAALRQSLDEIEADLRRRD